MALPMPDRIGYILADRYEIIAGAGRGGFSTVWEARDRNLEGKRWAVKEYRHTGTSKEGRVYKRSLIAEANLMKRLDHPNIVRVADLIDTGESIFVVMDFIEGRTLTRVLADERRAIPQEEVIDWGIQLCDALGYLHAQSPPIVYRDMKPGNVMLREGGQLKLIDFGIAREYDMQKTHDTTIARSEGYAAPEQNDPDVQTDPRADIYSLGMTLYHLVTGHDPSKPPFEIRPIREWDPQLSEGLEAIILRATQPDPDKRYQTIGEMRYDLEHYKELTSEYRAVLKHKVDTFRRWASAAAATLIASIGCFIGSAALRSSTYESYVNAAQTSSIEEWVDAEGNVMASPAEENYLRAIELEPGRIENYFALIELYKKDLLFTPTEEIRWQQLWARHFPEISSDRRFAKLNYDVAMLYLCYYDFGNTGDPTAGRTTGEAAVFNASRAEAWFQRASEAAVASDAAKSEFEEGELDSLESLLAMARFTGNVGRASAEGRERQVYGEFWEALLEVFAETSTSDAEPMVQLRVNQVVYETLRSQTYLRGLRRAGVSQQDARDLLLAVEVATAALADEAQANEQSLLPIYAEIVGGAEDAERNIGIVFENAVARQEGDLQPTDEVVDIPVDEDGEA